MAGNGLAVGVSAASKQRERASLSQSSRAARHAAIRWLCGVVHESGHRAADIHWSLSPVVQYPQAASLSQAAMQGSTGRLRNPPLPLWSPPPRDRRATATDRATIEAAKTISSHLYIPASVIAAQSRSWHTDASAVLLSHSKIYLEAAQRNIMNCDGNCKF